jgi:hypothetical protein
LSARFGGGATGGALRSRNGKTQIAKTQNTPNPASHFAGFIKHFLLKKEVCES